MYIVLFFFGSCTLLYEMQPPSLVVEQSHKLETQEVTYHRDHHAERLKRQLDEHKYKASASQRTRRSTPKRTFAHTHTCTSCARIKSNNSIRRMQCALQAARITNQAARIICTQNLRRLSPLFARFRSVCWASNSCICVLMGSRSISLSLFRSAVVFAIGCTRTRRTSHWTTMHDTAHGLCCDAHARTRKTSCCANCCERCKQKKKKQQAHAHTNRTLCELRLAFVRE